MGKPIIGLTMGDAAGIGPELIIRLYQEKGLSDKAKMIVIGDADIIEEAGKAVRSDVAINTVHSVNQALFRNGTIDVLDLNNLSRESFALGKVDKAIGKASVEYLIRALELALNNEIDAITSAPLNKEAMHMAGFHYAGQTELLADLTKTKKFGMMLIFGPIKMFYVTNHVSIRKALKKVKKEIILEKLSFINDALTEFHENKPIAVAALNPHAGEGGKMGTEEIEEIEPAVEEAVKRGIQVLGPLPADTLFLKAKEGVFGAVLAMYHDQGNIAAKLLKFGSGVTVVSGLPIVRTSVAHGTAFDIAGQGIASPEALIQAVLTAAEFVERKRSMP